MCNYNWIYFLIIQRKTVKLLFSLSSTTPQLVCCSVAQQSKVAGKHRSESSIFSELRPKTYAIYWHGWSLFADFDVLLFSTRSRVFFAPPLVTSILGQARDRFTLALLDQSHHIKMLKNFKEFRSLSRSSWSAEKVDRSKTYSVSFKTLWLVDYTQGTKCQNYLFTFTYKRSWHEEGGLKNIQK